MGGSPDMNSSAYNREYYEKNQGRIKAQANQYYHDHKEAVRLQRLQKTYGVTQERLDQLTKKQDGRCAICKNPVEPGGKNSSARLNVDHDHGTGRVRGLLCASCNKLLGYAYDKVEILLAAVEYLRKHNG